MDQKVKLAVLGAGLIGRRHIQYVLDEPQAELLAVVDPMPLRQQIAQESRAKWFPSFAAMIETDRPDGVIVEPTPVGDQGDKGLLDRVKDIFG